MGSGKSKSSRGMDAPKARGKVKNKEEAIELLRRTSFTHLPKEGREAFFRYLCNDKYPEDKDICDIDPKANGMDESSQKYQFWLHDTTPARSLGYRGPQSQCGVMSRASGCLAPPLMLTAPQEKKPPDPAPPHRTSSRPASPRQQS
ncbi:hypothetical protein O3P69_010309 [Scylla paramamosain]|uniref:Uncharacterized protein n=1 Tax=Scylla paramamosain TaxID=85552 RepID=A0AAW0TSJ2_SCYPA